MKIAVTGHRPQKLGGFSEQVFQLLVAFATRMLNAYKPTEVITGMALGWDQAVAMACVQMHIPFTAAIPCVEQERKWISGKERYYWLLQQAYHKVLVTDAPYTAYLMQVRNEWMVNECDVLVALWDGSSGGTGNCVAYAQRVGKPIKQVWDPWLRFQQWAATRNR